MKTIREKVFTVVEITDYSMVPVIAQFSNEAEAKKLLPYIGGYGGRIKEENVNHVIYDTFEEFLKHAGGSIRKKALDKLTPAEKLVLGL